MNKNKLKKIAKKIARNGKMNKDRMKIKKDNLMRRMRIPNKSNRMMGKRYRKIKRMSNKKINYENKNNCMI